MLSKRAYLYYFIIMKIEYLKPEYLICDTPIKDKSFNDHREWIYCTKALSLIEFIAIDGVDDFGVESFTYFNYTNIYGQVESYLGVYVQNNCEYTDNDENQIMQEAWEVYTQFLTNLDRFEHQ